MSDTILFLLEGADTEPRILTNLKSKFFDETTNVIVKTTFDKDIYQLYEKLKADPFQDIVELIRSSSTRNKTRLGGLIRTDIVSVFLLFDYDGHATKASNEKIEEMIEFFDDDMENGKLFISYPMAEAVRDFGNQYSHKENCTLISLGKGYKTLVGERKESKALDLNRWKYIIAESLKKANLIINDEYVLPTTEITLRQDEIFENQLAKFIQPHSKVAVLSGFPFFITEFFGRSIIEE